MSLPSIQTAWQWRRLSSLDVRSLALFRILTGIYIFYDIVSRLKQGQYALLWYTSTPGSWQHPDDTPHKSPFHQVWFYRGSPTFQIECFLVLAVTNLMYLLGYSNNGLLKFALWFQVVAMQHRNMHLHDGSDTYLRHLLLWSCQLPMAQVWSLDAARRRRSESSNRRPTAANGDCNPPQPPFVVVSSVASFGLRLQIVLMYLGTVLNRTTDRFDLFNLGRSEWMPPALTAVHYSLNAGFSTRPNMLGDLIRQTLPLSQMMTMGGMFVEGVVPLFVFVLGGFFTSGGILLFLLHFGLFLMMNLPNWQFLGMLTCVVWIPTQTWDLLERWRWFHGWIRISRPDETGKKHDDVVTSHSRIRQRRIPPIWTYLLLFYMIYNWCGERKWISKYDGGDIGEALRISQYWVMFGTPPHQATNAILALHLVHHRKDMHTTIDSITGNSGVGDDEEEELVVDGWQWLRGSRQLVPIDLDLQRGTIFTNMTNIYPSPRWERAWDQWGGRSDKSRARYFMQQLCSTEQQPHATEHDNVDESVTIVYKIKAITLIWQHLKVMQPNEEDVRFEKNKPDTVLRVKC